LCGRGRGKKPEEADRQQLRIDSNSELEQLQWGPAGGVLIPVDLVGEKLGRGLGKMEELTTNPFVRSI